MPNTSREPSSPDPHVCPSSLAWFLDNPIRRLIWNPDRILTGLIQPGQTALDLGCGPGVFSAAMARGVGESGRVIAVDLQPAMLDHARRRAEREGVLARIRFHLGEPDRLGLDDRVDFALAFYMVHEVPDTERFLAEVRGLLKPTARFLVVEPRWHVTEAAFQRMLSIARSVGLQVSSQPAIRFSRAAVFVPNTSEG